MPRTFNTAEPCLSEEHHMIPGERRLSEIRALIDNECFCVLHAARQTGKTTLIRNFARQLTAEGRPGMWRPTPRSTSRSSSPVS